MWFDWASFGLGFGVAFIVIGLVVLLIGDK